MPKNSRRQQTIVALLSCLPLAPFIFISSDVLNHSIGKISYSLIPVFIEFFAITLVYAFVRDRHTKLTVKESHNLLVLAGGLFIVIGIPLAVMNLIFASDPVGGKLLLFVLMFYAGYNLYMNLKKVHKSAEAINHFYFRQYVYPASVSLVGFFIGSLLLASTINPVVAYYIIKQFSFIK